MARLELWDGTGWFAVGGSDLPDLTEGNIWVGNASNRPTATNNPVLGGMGSITIPRGTTAQRPGSPASGMLRYNSTTNEIEFYNGTSWATGGEDGTVTSITAGDGLTGGVITESGTIALGGVTLTGPVTGTAVIGTTSTSIATSFADNPVLPGTESVRLPSGTTLERPSSPVAGDFRYNSTGNVVEFYNGTSWTSGGGPGTVTSITAGDGLTGGTITDSGTIALGGVTLTGVVTGTAVIGQDSTSIATSFVNNPVLPGTESVRLPSGTTAQRPTLGVAGMLRYNTTINGIEFYNGTSWTSGGGGGGGPGTVTSVTAGAGLTGGTITNMGTITLGSITLQGATTGTATIEDDSTTINTAFMPNAVLPGAGGVVPPSGTTGQRPTNPQPGTIRFNTQANIEAFENLDFGRIGGVSNNEIILNNADFVGNTSCTLPVGTTAQRPASPRIGQFRYNTSLGPSPEFYNGFGWIPCSGTSMGTVTSVTAGNGLDGGVISINGGISLGNITLTGDVEGSSVISDSSTIIATNIMSFSGTGSVTPPVGTNLQRPSSRAAGMFRYNSNLGFFEYYNGVNWRTAINSGSGSITSITAGDGLVGGEILSAGTISLGTIFLVAPTGIFSQVSIGENSTNITFSLTNRIFTAANSMTLPRGTTAQRPSILTAGILRYNTTNNIVECYNGTSWIAVGAGTTGTVTSITTGNGFRSGTITASGTAELGDVELGGDAEAVSVNIGPTTTTIDSAIGANVVYNSSFGVRLPVGGFRSNDLPAGTVRIDNRGAANVLEYYNGTIWRRLVGR